MTIFDFRDPTVAGSFVPVDDVVMGGRSSSRMVPTGEGTAAFEGSVSLENNGGFASVRSVEPELDLGRAAGLVLEVRGDGRRYKVNLRSGKDGDRIAYQVPFETRRGAWQTIVLPFPSFEPRRRGRPRPDAGPIDRSRVRSVGLMVSGRQTGDFRLEVRRIGAMVSREL